MSPQPTTYWWKSTGFRLYASISFIVLGTLLVAVTSSLLFQQLSATVSQVANRDIPSTAAVAQLANWAGSIEASAALLVYADNETQRTKASDNLHSLLDQETGNQLSAQTPTLNTSITNVKEQLSRLEQSAEERVSLNQELQRYREELYWLQQDFAQEIDPMLEEARYYTRNALSSGTSSNVTIISLAEFEQRDLLSSFKETVNLLFEYMQQALGAKTVTELLTQTSRLDETFPVLDRQLTTLAQLPSAITMVQITTEIRRLVYDEKSAMTVKREALQLSIDSQQQLRSLQAAFIEMNREVGAVVSRTRADTLSLTQQLDHSVSSAQRLLAFVAVAALIIAAVTGWVLRYQLIGRLVKIIEAIQRLAAGDLYVSIDTRGHDEIARLAHSLRVFKYNAREIVQQKDLLEETNTRLQTEIQQRIETERELRETQDELIQAGKLAILGQLTAGIVHEFNQPLAAIRNNLHITRHYIENGLPGKATAKLKDIDRLIAKTSQLSRHLKTFARKSDGKLVATPLSSTVANAVELVHDAAIKKGLMIEVAETGLIVQADPIRLEQVLVNLLSNAIDATDSGKIAVSIEEQHSHQPGLVAVRVTDTGHGMDDEVKTQVFEPFFTTKPVGDGLGLGMSIIYNIIRDFGGSIEISSTPQQGTEVSVWLRKSRS
ncbi:ATP-binding protein [Parasalinivibrio latis]|uniref:ATP-binding protein n=1 Tax=Parasalinivibrio latis TaxID=2952610 RepID=UPI0030E1B3D4